MGRKKVMGRPPENLYDKYVKGKEDALVEYCEHGADLKGLATFVGCGLTTLKRIKKEFPEFQELIKKGNEVADDQIVSSLYRRALGYDAEETVTEVRVTPDGSAQTTYVKKVKKHIPGDTTAMIFWLKNRRRKEWTDSQDISLDSSEPINISIVPYGKRDDRTE